MNIVFYILYLSRMGTVEPMAKYESAKECRGQAIELNVRAKKNKQKVKYFCDQLKDNYVSKPFDYFYVLDIPYCNEKDDCQFQK